MTALQSGPLQPHPALDWPLEPTEFAYLGDWIVNWEDTPAIVREVWIRTDEPRYATELSLCGTTMPGDVHFHYSADVEEPTDD